MHPLTSLIREHQVTTRLVAGLIVYAQYLQREDSDAVAGDLEQFARFFREFADALHHEKEEGILLPMLARHGFSWDEGIVAEVRSDHEQERYLIDVLCQASERCHDWSFEDRRSICATALELAAFQRAHLDRENTLLFPRVTEQLSAAALDDLRQALEHFDAFPRHRELSDQLLQVAEGLISRYAPYASQATRNVNEQLVAADVG